MRGVFGVSSSDIGASAVPSRRESLEVGVLGVESGPGLIDEEAVRMIVSS